MKDIIKVDDANFEQVTASGIVLIDFYADWCGPCRMLTPILEALAAEMNGQVVVAKLDVDQATKTTTNFQITSVPTL
ncbi:MAG: thiol reductase thioredoxin, partial [Verrucomicrobia bacterium]|nr:thiol reductase thioredoxin [Verrucomicrobiota bacterium]